MQTTTVTQLLKAAPLSVPLALIGAVSASAAAGALAAAQRYAHVASPFEEPLQRLLTIAGAAMMLLATHRFIDGEPENDEIWFEVSDRSRSN
jgi:hypothetical protein